MSKYLVRRAFLANGRQWKSGELVPLQVARAWHNLEALYSVGYLEAIGQSDEEGLKYGIPFKSDRIVACARKLLNEQNTLTVENIRIEVEVSVPFVIRTLRGHAEELHIRERIVAASSRGGKKLIFEKVR